MNHSTSTLLAILAGILIITASVPLAPAQQRVQVNGPAFERGPTTVPVDDQEPQLTVIQEARQRNCFSFWAGAGFPTGDFGSRTTDKAGYANPGFTMGLGYLVGITHDFGWTSQIDFVVNGLADFQDTVTGGPAWNTLKPSTGTWLTVWPMTGLEITVDIHPDVRLFGDILFGMVIGDMPRVEFSNANSHTTFDGRIATAFAYGFVGGLAIADRYLLRVSFTMATPKYEVNVTGTTVPQQSFKIEQPTSILRVAVGIEI